MMKVIGTNFTSIEAKRYEIKKDERISGVTTNINIDKVEAAKQAKLPTKEGVFVTSFTFTVTYPVKKKKNFAEVICKGDIVSVDDEKVVKDIVTAWKKKKKVPREIYLALIRVGFEMSIVEAMVLAEKLKIPQPIPIMRLLEVQMKKAEQDKKYIG
jgi:hypothetical protein